MKFGDKVGLIACSNGIELRYEEQINQLFEVITEAGLIPVVSDCLYDKGFGFSGTGKERAEALMHFYENDEIKAIFDISGGDLGNAVLPYLDYDVIANSKKKFWGYSDLTTIMNAIYAKTGKSSVLYQVRNLVNDQGDLQKERFIETILGGGLSLYGIRYEFLQGNSMSGIVIGGNIRCLLKLAGTEYWPDFRGKILFLEARSGRLPQIVTYLSQLKQLGVFEQVKGVLFGTFTELSRNKNMPQMKEIIFDYVGSDIPVAMTDEVGHGTDSKALVIGERIDLA